ncbi:hypothetical protein [Micromonospora sp. RL09-050-HVF-A]|uniref:hypothetical protein n=1 Tax=Micromonospora sp. RL09-050-HVF-A TaxID=1703433 RepID=UPI001C5D595E|nr:hypothetical protein [Micromonospora sp. RL09-050-HVF-A]MBW4704653.1 hypothetical protein [Micromonospora sp. RL09-050-HVF-A]
MAARMTEVRSGGLIDKSFRFTPYDVVECAVPSFAAAILGVQRPASFLVGGTHLLVVGLRVEPGSQLHGALVSSADRDGEIAILYAVGPRGVINCRMQDYRPAVGEMIFAVCTPTGMGRLALRTRAT